MAQALRGFMPPAKRSQYDTVTVDFLGIELVLELDYQGVIEGILSPNGTQCYSEFETSIPALDKLVEAQRKKAKDDAECDRGEELYNERQAA